MKTILIVKLFLAASLVMPRSHAQTNELDHKTFFEHTKTKAGQGDVLAQALLGACYTNGEGVATNPTEGAKWIRKAAEQGDAKAQANMGLCHVLGMGVDESKEDAYLWFSLAASQDIQSARNNLAKLEHMMSPEQLMSARKRALEMRRKIELNREKQFPGNSFQNR